MDNIFFDDNAYYCWKFKNKSYAHFDSWYSCKKSADEIKTNIKDTGQLNHRFYPFIRIRMTKSKKDEKGRIKKSRFIMHTARIDSNVYSMYRNRLMNKYEKLLEKLEISQCVIAYRKVPRDDNIKEGKCSIHFANDAIEEIQQRCISNGKCSAITMDVKNFFDTLDHDLIKSQWCRVMGFVNGMPRDHYSVYKNITKYRYVDEKKLKKALKFTFRDLREKNQKQICSSEEFREKVKPILSKRNCKGIPQGTTISDVIANMYMLDFDFYMKKFAEKCSAYYRRYSDDILFICPCDLEGEAIQFILDLLALTTKTLKMNHSKTIVSRFHRKDDEVLCVSLKNVGSKEENINKPFEYLGLSFDGCKINIRQSTISGFYRKLCISIKKEVRASKDRLTSKEILWPSADQIYAHVNFKKIRNRFMVKKLDPRDGKDKKKYNFHGYIKLASKVTGNTQILDMFKDLGGYIKEQARKYSAML